MSQETKHPIKKPIFLSLRKTISNWVRQTFWDTRIFSLTFFLHSRWRITFKFHFSSWEYTWDKKRNTWKGHIEKFGEGKKLVNSLNSRMEEADVDSDEEKKKEISVTSRQLWKKWLFTPWEALRWKSWRRKEEKLYGEEKVHLFSLVRVRCQFARDWASNSNPTTKLTFVCYKGKTLFIPDRRETFCTTPFPLL